MAENTDKKIIWYVHRPTYMSALEPPSLWRLEEVKAGSERDKMLATGWTTNDAGEWVPLPGEWWWFKNREDAEAWMHAEAQRFEMSL